MRHLIRPAVTASIPPTKKTDRDHHANKRTSASSQSPSKQQIGLQGHQTQAYRGERRQRRCSTCAALNTVASRPQRTNSAADTAFHNARVARRDIPGAFHGAPCLLGHEGDWEHIMCKKGQLSASRGGVVRRQHLCKRVKTNFFTATSSTVARRKRQTERRGGNDCNRQLRCRRPTDPLGVARVAYPVQLEAMATVGLTGAKCIDCRCRVLCSVGHMHHISGRLVSPTPPFQRGMVALAVAPGGRAPFPPGSPSSSIHSQSTRAHDTLPLTLC